MNHLSEPAHDAPDWMRETEACLLVIVANLARGTADTGDTVRIENILGNRIGLSLTSGNEVIEVFHTCDATTSAANRAIELRDWLHRYGVSAKTVGFPVVRR